MDTAPKTIVDVFPGSALTERPRLFSALQAAFPVIFRPYAEGLDDAAGVIALTAGGDGDLPGALARRRCPVFVASGSAAAGGEREEIRLRDDPGLDRRLRGIALHDRLAGPLEPRAERAAVLASARSGPAWTVSPGDAAIYRVRSILAELEPHQVLWSMLSRRPIAFVAVVQFLRSLCGPADWRPPALRATFMFDDPNLHWRSYGFIDYRRLVEHADEHGYHAAMATVPLDGARAHRPTAGLFARRPDRLSLVVHGNDHVKEELHAVRDPDRALAVAAQAWSRISRFERRSGVRVDRVMTPPHGLCSREMTHALGAVGFDALCAEHPLPWTDDLPPERVLAGWRAAEFVGGCAVIPRMPLDSSTASIALRAFLGQPLVIYGHHQDVAGGLEPLAAAAATVNRLGDVRWLSTGEIARSNAQVRIAGERAEVRPLSRRIRLLLPEQVRTVTIHAPEDLLREGELAGWSIAGGPVTPFGVERTIGAPDVSVRLHGHGDVEPRGVPAPVWRPRPKLRRVAVEVRDRALPLAAAAGLVR